MTNKALTMAYGNGICTLLHPQSVVHELLLKHTFMGLRFRFSMELSPEESNFVRWRGLSCRQFYQPLQISVLAYCQSDNQFFKEAGMGCVLC